MRRVLNGQTRRGRGRDCRRRARRRSSGCHLLLVSELLFGVVHVSSCSEDLRLLLREVEKARSCFMKDIHCQHSNSPPNKQLRESEYQMYQNWKRTYNVIFIPMQASCRFKPCRESRYVIIQHKGDASIQILHDHLCSKHSIQCSCVSHIYQYTQRMRRGSEYTHQSAIQLQQMKGRFSYA